MFKFLVATFLACSAVSPNQVKAESLVTVAYRSDAPPFSFLSDGGYSGFVADVCDKTLEKIEETIQVTKISANASDRFEKLLTGEADILCGSASMTSDRFEDFVFSIPIFISGISYATVVTDNIVSTNPAGAKAAILRNTTTFTQSDSALFKEYFGVAGSRFFSDISILRSDQNKPTEGYESILVVDSYIEGFKRLCDNTVQFLIGDVDILNSLSKNIEGFKECHPVVVRRTLTREVYGVVFSPRFLEVEEGRILFRKFQSSLFSLYQDGTISKLFSENFHDQVMSDELAQLFRLFDRNVSR